MSGNKGRECVVGDLIIGEAKQVGEKDRVGAVEGL